MTTLSLLPFMYSKYVRLYHLLYLLDKSVVKRYKEVIWAAHTGLVKEFWSDVFTKW